MFCPSGDSGLESRLYSDTDTVTLIVLKFKSELVKSA